jgi:replicative DNA helicase
MATTPDLFEGTLAPIRYHVTKAQDKLAQWRTGQPEGLSTGFKALDEFFRLVDSEMITIAARPSMGKTALGMQLVENMAHQLAPDGVESDTGVIAVFSAEMAGWSLAVRMAAVTCGVNSHRARFGNLSGTIGDEVASAHSVTAYEMHFFAGNPAATHAAQFQALMTALRSKYGLA